MYILLSLRCHLISTNKFTHYHIFPILFYILCVEIRCCIIFYVIFTFCYWQLNLKLRCDVLQESVPYLGEIWLNWPNIITIIRPWSSRRRKKPQIVIAGEKTAGVESQLLWRFWCNFDKLDGNAETCSVLSSHSAAIRKLRHFLLIFISHSRLHAQHIQWILTWNKTLMINIFFKLDNVYANLYFTYSCFGKLSSTSLTRLLFLSQAVTFYKVGV